MDIVVDGDDDDEEEEDGVSSVIAVERSENIKSANFSSSSSSSSPPRFRPSSASLFFFLLLSTNILNACARFTYADAYCLFPSMIAVSFDTAVRIASAYFTVSSCSCGCCKGVIASSSCACSLDSSAGDMPGSCWGREESRWMPAEAFEGEDSASKRAWRTAESLEERWGVEGVIAVAEEVILSI